MDRKEIISTKTFNTLNHVFELTGSVGWDQYPIFSRLHKVGSYQECLEILFEYACSNPEAALTRAIGTNIHELQELTGGKSRLYYPNGKLAMIATRWDFGVLDGEVITYDKDTDKQTVSMYDNGEEVESTVKNDTIISPISDEIIVWLTNKQSGVDSFNTDLDDETSDSQEDKIEGFPGYDQHYLDGISVTVHENTSIDDALETIHENALVYLYGNDNENVVIIYLGYYAVYNKQNKTFNVLFGNEEDTYNTLSEMEDSIKKAQSNGEEFNDASRFDFNSTESQLDNLKNLADDILRNHIKYCTDFLNRWEADKENDEEDLYQLSEEYQKYCTDNKLPQMSADELQAELLGALEDNDTYYGLGNDSNRSETKAKALKYWGDSLTMNKRIFDSFETNAIDYEIMRDEFLEDSEIQADDELKKVIEGWAEEFDLGRENEFRR